MVLAKLNFYMQKNEIRFTMFTLYKNQSKKIKDLNLKPEALKSPDENTGHTLWHQGRKTSWININNTGIRPKHQEIELYEIKKFLHSKSTASRAHRQLTKWKKVLSGYTSDKGLISKIYKELKILNTKEMNLPINKWAEKTQKYK